MLTAIRNRAATLTLTSVSRRVLADRLTYLQVDKLRTLERLSAQINKQSISGDVIECGIALGGSAIVLATLSGRPFQGYDVFGMIPPPSENDPPEVHERYRDIAAGESKGIDGDDYYGYVTDLYDRVCASLAAYDLPVDNARVSLHQGLFEDTLRVDRPIAVGHIDSDWHDPVKLCLERLWPVLSPGGFLVLDDYNDYGGCRTAADAFISATLDAEMVQTQPNAVLVKREILRAERGSVAA
jgi:O-methyltransferase